MMKPTSMIRVGKHAVLLGLHWEDLQATSRRTARRGATAQAARHGAKRGVVYETPRGLWLAGLVPKGAAEEASGHSGAIWLSEAVTGPTLLIAELEPQARYWIAVSDGGCTLDGDQVLSMEQAEARIERALADFERRSVVPQVFIAGGTYPAVAALEDQRVRWKPTTLVTLLGETPPYEAALTQLTGVPKIAVWAGLALLGIVAIGVLVYGIGVYAEHRAREQLAEEARRAQQDFQSIEAANAAERQRRIEAAVAAAVAQATATSPPAESIAGCANVARALGKSVAGWEVREIVCDIQGQSATVLFGYPTGSQYRATSAALSSRLAERGMTAEFLGSGVEATVVLPLVSESRPPLQREDLPLLREELVAISTRAQLAGQAVGSANAWTLEAPIVQAIVYVEPGRDDDEDPSRFVPVPPEASFHSALMRAQGQTLWRAEELAVDRRSITVAQVRFAPQASDWQWSVEARYVAR